MCAMLSRNDEEYEYWYRRNEREDTFRDTDDEPIISDVYYWKIPVDYRRYRYVCEDTDSIIKFLGDRYQLIINPTSLDDALDELKEWEPEAIRVIYDGNCQTHEVSEEE